MTDKQIQEAAIKTAVNISRIYDQNSIRYGFELGANFVQSQSQWIPVDKRLPSYGELIVLQYPPEQKRLPYVVVFDRDTPLFDGSEWFPVPLEAETK